MQSRSELRLWRARSSNKFQCVILAGAQQRVEGVRTRAMGSLGRVVSRMRFTENDFSLGLCHLWKIYSRLAWPPWETTWMEARGKRKFNASWPLAACGLSYMCRHFALIIRLRLLIVNCLVIRLGEDARSLLQLIILLSGRHSTKRPRTVPGIVRNILNNYRSASENRLRTNSRTYSESVSKQHRESL